jgi:hypothetical protein
MNASSRRNNSNCRNKATRISMITGMQATEKTKLATAMMQPTARTSAKEGRPEKGETSTAQGNSQHQIQQ